MSSFNMSSETRGRVNGIARQIKENDTPPTITELSESFGISESSAGWLKDIAEAWVKRERVGSYFDQLHSGQLEGSTPIGSVSGSKERDIG